MKNESPLLTGGLDKMIHMIQRFTRAHRGVVNAAVVIAVADTLVKRYPEQDLGHMQLRTRVWARHLFICIGFAWRTAATGKVEIPEVAKKEGELTFLNDAVNEVKEFQVLPSLILIDNINQINPKICFYGQDDNGEKRFHIRTDRWLKCKRSVTVTFNLTPNWIYLPMQLICGGRTVPNLPKIDFHEGFFLSANLKHYSNTAESINLIKEIIVA